MYRIVFLLLMTLFLSSCLETAKSIYISSKPPATGNSISGKVALIGFEGKDPIYVWTESYGNYSITYSIPFRSPEIVLKSFYKNLDKDLSSKLLIKKINLDSLKELMAKTKKQRLDIEDNPAYGYYPIFEDELSYFDSANNTRIITNAVLNSLLLPYIADEYADADYLMLVYASIKGMYTPGLFNGFSLTIFPHITIIIYNKSGIREFYKDYTEPYEKKDAGQIYKEIATYYDCLINVIEKNAANINNDLRSVIN